MRFRLLFALACFAACVPPRVAMHGVKLAASVLRAGELASVNSVEPARPLTPEQQRQQDEVERDREARRARAEINARQAGE
jgi:hypothetical protein